MSAPEGMPRRVADPPLVPVPNRVPAPRIRRVVVAVGIVFALLFLVGIVPRLVQRYRLRSAATAVENRLPLVTTVSPRRAPEVLEIPLPGSIEPILETGIWARTDGYLKAR